jgi:hypothetical protein
MASLTGSSIASSYTSLLKLNGNTDNIVAGNGSNAIQIVDGDGTASPLYLNADRLGIGGQPDKEIHLEGNEPTFRIEQTADANKYFDLQVGSGGGISKLKFSSEAQSNTLVISNNARVGINNGAPSETLDVTGSTKISGDVLVAEYIKHEGDTDTNIRFQTDHIDLTTANTLALRVDSSQNVGIGTASPSTKLHTTGTILIDQSAGTSNSAVLRLEADRGSSGQDSGEIRFYNQGGSDHDYARIVGVRGGADNSGSLQFRTSEAGTEVTGMTISSTGNVGIGISNPTSGANWSQFLQINHTTNSALVLTETDSTQSCDVATNGAGMFIDVAGHSDATNNNINFRTEETNSSYSPTTRMTITYYGAILPGADDTQDLGSSSLRFDDVFATNGTIQTSDERLKDNITDSSLGLDFVNALRPVKYQWKDYTYDVEKEKAVEAKEAVYETVVVQEAVEAKEAVMGKRQKTVSKEVEKTKTEIVEEDGKYVQKEVSYTETVEEPQYEEVNLYDEDGEVIGSHKIPVMEEYEVEPAIEAVKEITEERLVSEAIEAKDAVMETKEKTFARTHFGLIAQEVEQVLKDSSLTNNDFAGLIYDEDADRYGMRYHELIAPLIKAIQELSKKVTDLENK